MENNPLVSMFYTNIAQGMPGLHQSEINKWRINGFSGSGKPVMVIFMAVFAFNGPF